VAETIASESTAIPASKSLPGRIIGVLTSPRETYADIARRPTWLGMFLVVVTISGACGGWLSSTTVGRRAALDKAEEGLKIAESLGARIPEAQRATMRERVMSTPDWRMYLQAGGGALVFGALVFVVIAGILLGVFNAILGGDAKFKQVFAVVVFSEAVIVVGTLFTTPLNYYRESLSSPTTFAALAPMLDENGMLAKMLGSIDFFRLWWLVSLSIGLGVLYKRPTRGIAVSLIGIYVVVAVTIAAGLALIAG